MTRPSCPRHPADRLPFKPEPLIVEGLLDQLVNRKMLPFIQDHRHAERDELGRMVQLDVLAAAVEEVEKRLGVGFIIEVKPGGRYELNRFLRRPR